MPEGHTVRRLALQFQRELAGEKVAVSSPQGWFADGAALLDGEVLERTDAAGKHLFLGFSNGRWMHVHLGLYGKWQFGPTPPPEPRGALRVRIESAERYADLRGPNQCEVVHRGEVDEIIGRLGPDPLRPARRQDARREEFVRRVRRSRVSIAALLMDQKVVAGVGNVYRAEVLFRAGLDPETPGRDLDEETAGRLWDDLAALLRTGVRQGHIVTTLPADRPRGARRSGVPARDHRFYVYRRQGEPCRICGAPVQTRELVGRNLFWCPVCQA